MKRWICGVAILVLVGCSTVPSVPTRPQTQAATIRTSGGPFSAQYSGNYSLKECSQTGTGRFNFNGSGSGSFIHGSTEIGNMTGNLSFRICNWKGRAELISSLHPRNSIVVLLDTTGFNQGPCGVQHSFEVTSGTGRFAHAMGNGTVAFMCKPSKGTYTDQWSGTVSF